MSKQNITAWFFESGMVGIPKHVLGLMEPLGLNFDDLGKIVYLLYCGTDQVKRNDRYAVEAAKSLQQKGMVNWSMDQETVDFSPMFDKISRSLGDEPVYVDQKGFTTDELNYSGMIKKIQQEIGQMLSVSDMQPLEIVRQRYSWSYDLVAEIYIFFHKNYRRSQYSFDFFCKMAFGAKVDNKESFNQFIKGLDRTYNKVVEVKKRLGHRNNPSEEEKECYLKWVNLWKFSHEMILLAVKQTVYAANPSFGYLDAILKNWHEKQLDTPEKLEQYNADLEKHKKESKSEKKGTESVKQQKSSRGKYVKESYTHENEDLSYLFE